MVTLEDVRARISMNGRSNGTIGAGGHYGIFCSDYRCSSTENILTGSARLIALTSSSL
jgi:hypothetical protein